MPGMHGFVAPGGIRCMAPTFSPAPYRFNQKTCCDSETSLHELTGPSSHIIVIWLQYITSLVNILNKLSAESL